MEEGISPNPSRRSAQPEVLKGGEEAPLGKQKAELPGVAPPGVTGPGLLDPMLPSLQRGFHWG